MTKLSARHNQRRPSNGLLTRLFLPLECLGCNAEGDWICSDCLAQTALTRPTICVVCGKAGQDGLCDSCRQSTKLDGAVSLLPYHFQPIQRLIRAVKFAGQFDGLLFFAHHFRREIERRLPVGSWAMVPIPLSKERQRQRGFNQSLLLSEQLDLGELWLGLDRVRHTSAQAELTASERAKNVRGAFVARAPAPQNVILIDDVVTTGATVREAARALKRAGSQTIWVITIAHG
jgi:ComF family protein